MKEMALGRADLLRDSMLIGGEWRKPRLREPIPVTNPATGEIVGTVPDGGAAETVEAIQAASASLGAWRDMPAPHRADILAAWQSAMRAHRDDLSLILTSEQGKPLQEARDEIDYAASFLGWFAGEAVRVAGHDIPAPSADRRILVRRQPVGVCAAITPWNFPAAMVTRKLGPALAAGCTMVLKPSELAPLTALAIARLGEEAGLPPGVLNVVTGDAPSIGDAIMQSSAVRKVSFTGSTAVGRKLIEASALMVKRLSLELGGNAPFIIFEDADLELAIEGAMASKFRNAGQTCVCANRFLVHTSVFDAFINGLAARVTNLAIGNGVDPATRMGPLINSAAAAKVKAQYDDAVALGARSILIPPIELTPPFAAPAILADCNMQMRVAREETFGPLAAIFPFEDETEAIELANASESGLAAYFYTNDVGRCWRVLEALDHGMVGINTGSISMAMAPFGGMKQSGYGREGGIEGIHEYLETKAVHWSALNRI